MNKKNTWYFFICNCQSNNSLNKQSLKSNPAKIYPFAFHSHAFRESIQHARHFRSNDRIEIECYEGPVDNRINTPSDWLIFLEKERFVWGFCTVSTFVCHSCHSRYSRGWGLSAQRFPKIVWVQNSHEFARSLLYLLKQSIIGLKVRQGLFSTVA